MRVPARHDSFRLEPRFADTTAAKRRGGIAIGSTPTRTGALLARLEPVAVAGVATHALLAWSGLELGLWRWPLAAVLGSLGASALYGLIRPGGTTAVARAFTATAVVVVMAELAAGITASVWTAWLATLAMFLPMSLDVSVAAATVPVVTAASYFGAALWRGGLTATDAGMRAAAFFAGGVAAYLVGHVVRGLRVERDTAATRLEEAESVIDTAFASSLGGMAVLEVNGTILAANTALAELVGTPSEPPDGIEWPLLFHPVDAPQMAEAIERLAVGEWPSFEAEARFLQPDGGVSHALVGLSRVDGPAGAPRHLFAHATNITARVRSERRLRQSESHYRHLFELSPVPLWEIDISAVVSEAERREPFGGLTGLEDRPGDVAKLLASTRVLNVNEAARILLRAVDEDDFGAGLAQGRLGRDHAAAYADLLVGISRGILQGERPVQIRDFDGAEHVGLLRVLVPLVDGEPDHTGVVVAFVDTTEQAETEQTLVELEEQLHTVMSGAPIIVFAIDADGVFTLSEGKALSLIGQSPGSVVGRSIFEVHRGSPSLIRNMRRALAGESFTGVDEIGELLLETRYSPILNGGRVDGVIGVSYDITDRVRTAERLRDLVRSKDDFVATVSHELRTPLTAVVGFAHELRSGIGELSEEDVAGYVALIEEQGIEVADLVEDLLVASRVGHGEVPISLAAVDLWEQVDAVIGARPLTKEVDTSDRTAGAKVFGDAIRVRQILRNLLINADRYGGLSVQVRIVEQQGSLLLDVRDDGNGIPELHRKFIFEPYHRAHRDEGRTESVGLGLTVSRHLAELMDGSLAYDRSEGWTVFTLTLPAA